MKTIFNLMLIFCSVQLAIAQQHKLISPDKNIKLELQVNDQINWKLFYKKELIVDKGKISMLLNNRS